MMRRMLFIIMVTGLPRMLSGQSSPGYDILTERYVDRPLAMHRGQLQVNTGYDFSIINRKYDLQGNSIDLATDGSVSARHAFPLNLNYGILEFIQVSASIRYASMGIRSQNRIYTTGVIGSTSTREINTYKGPEDLFLGIAISNPFRLDFLDVTLSGGISLPLFDHKTGQPSHKMEFLDPYPGSMDIEYYYNNKFALGVPVGAIGAAVKGRSPRFSGTARVDYSAGLKEGESTTWQSRFSNGEILYREIPYDFHVGNTLDYGAEIAWQAIDWFAVRISFEGSVNTGAWSTQTGKKVLTGDITLHSVSIGYDIQVAPVLRINQRLVLPYAGKNILAPRIFQTGISLNFLAPAPR